MYEDNIPSDEFTSFFFVFPPKLERHRRQTVSVLGDVGLGETRRPHAQLEAQVRDQDPEGHKGRLTGGMDHGLPHRVELVADGGFGVVGKPVLLGQIQHDRQAGPEHAHPGDEAVEGEWIVGELDREVEEARRLGL